MGDFGAERSSRALYIYTQTKSLSSLLCSHLHSRSERTHSHPRGMGSGRNLSTGNKKQDCCAELCFSVERQAWLSKELSSMTLLASLIPCL